MKNRSGWLAAIPVVLVNVVAFAGQLAYLREHLPWPLPGQVLMAVTLEAIAVYLAWQAHLAQLANDSALRLRLAAYGFALLIAAMNYSHYAGPHWAPTFAAVAVALCSAASPWLWGIHTRRASRDVLMALGKVEPHALRLGGTRWTWHAYRSARVMWAATWTAETDPAAAIGAVYPKDVAGETIQRQGGQTHLPGPGNSPATPPAVPVRIPVPGVAEIRGRRSCGQRAAQVARDEVRRYSGLVWKRYEIPAREVAPVLAAPAGDVPTSPPVPAGALDLPAGTPVDGTAQLAPAGALNGHRP